MSIKNNKQNLLDAAENVLIAYGMGWDMDGVIFNLQEATDAIKEAVNPPAPPIRQHPMEMLNVVQKSWDYLATNNPEMMLLKFYDPRVSDANRKAICDAMAHGLESLIPVSKAIVSEAWACNPSYWDESGALSAISATIRYLVTPQ